MFSIKLLVALTVVIIALLALGAVGCVIGPVMVNNWAIWIENYGKNAGVQAEILACLQGFQQKGI